jgi:SpoVK/Ycf46/Vps4 family AAA+-type ATPase
VLPEGEKDLALAFVQNKKTMKVDVDFVYGKGRGLVILMFGPPGVGKTFTAEAVAEECHLPLYSMCAGDLGTRAKEVEKGIDSIFECCALWNCILLLDEADVFMSVRTNEGLDRNEVSIGDVNIRLELFIDYDCVCSSCPFF